MLPRPKAWSDGDPTTTTSIFGSTDRRSSLHAQKDQSATSSLQSREVQTTTRDRDAMAFVTA
jgi:hypothetical protein